jgi:protein MpaA
VDLNRNFPAANWREGETVYRWNSAAQDRDVVLLTGEKPGSEPETEALCHLIHKLHPAWVVSFHDPLACIEDPAHSPLGRWLADAFSLPLVSSVGYETPGSFGSWCADLSLHCITAEFPPISSDEASEKYLRAMTNLLRWEPQR